MWMEISRKLFEIEAWYQLPTNRKLPMADRMMTSSVTSRDHERSMLCVLDNFQVHYLEHGLTYRLSYYGACTGN